MYSNVHSMWFNLTSFRHPSVNLSYFRLNALVVHSSLVSHVHFPTSGGLIIVTAVAYITSNVRLNVCLRVDVSSFTIRATLNQLTQLSHHRHTPQSHQSFDFGFRHGFSYIDGHIMQKSNRTPQRQRDRDRKSLQPSDVTY